MNYAIFRSEPIYTLSDLAQIGSHNKREKKAYNSNPDIKLELSKNNIQLVPLNKKYVKGFYELTKEYKKEYEARMKHERPDRKRTFKQMLDRSKNVVADELLFTATSDFFKNMNRDDIKKWADTCMEFVYNDLGYTKDQVLHSVVHMDEKTPHIHCVVVPLIRKYDKRAKREKYTISKKAYIKDKIHLSELQDKYHKRLTDKGFDLERGIKNSDNEHISIKEYKKITRKLNQKLNMRNEKLENAISDLDNKMKTNKETLFDKDYVKIKKDTFDSMNKVIFESKKIMEIQPVLKKVYSEVDSYTQSYQYLQKENNNIKAEINYLRNRNEKLNKENNRLTSYLKAILRAIKQFFRHLLIIGNKDVQKATNQEIKEYYNNKDFDNEDIYDIAKNTDSEKELFEYADISHYYSYKEKSHDKDDFCL